MLFKLKEAYQQVSPQWSVRGLPCGQGFDTPPLLQFADDTLLFCKFDDQMLLKLKEDIRLFEWCSGQKVNWEKSASSGVNIPEDILLQTADRIGCKAENLPIVYFSSGGYPRCQELWQPVIDPIHKKLDKWKCFNISRGGRQILCNAVLANLPTYCLSLFSIPQHVAVSLEKITRNFFWEGFSGSKLNHLVKWNLVSLLLKGGVLGLGGLKTHNSALLAKWGWRFAMVDSDFWRKIICSIHGKEPFDWFTLGKFGNSLRSPSDVIRIIIEIV